MGPNDSQFESFDVKTSLSLHLADAFCGLFFAKFSRCDQTDFFPINSSYLHPNYLNVKVLKATKMKWWRLVTFLVLADSFHRNALSEVLSLPAEQWVEPFNNEENLRILCTDNNHFDIMRGRESPLVNIWNSWITKLTLLDQQLGATSNLVFEAVGKPAAN